MKPRDNLIKKQNLSSDLSLDEINKKIDEMIDIRNGDKKSSPEYEEMIKTHQEELDRICKEGHDCPWEWSCGFDYLVEFIKFMRDYYKLGINVWSMETKDEDPKKYKNTPTRLQTLEKTLYYYNMWVGTEDRYIKVINHPETRKTKKLPDGRIQIIDFGFHCEYKLGSAKRTYKRIRKEENKYKKLFFNMLYKYMESWWD